MFFFHGSNYFINHIFDDYPRLAEVPVGFVSEHSFIKMRDSSLKLRNNYSGKFILSFFDNNIKNDTVFSESLLMHLVMMFIELLEKYPQLVIFFKPKRPSTMKLIERKLPVLNKLKEQKRIDTFLGVGDQIYASPAEIALASDLVIGQHISSAAAEAYFAGTLAFHANLVKIKHNYFAEKGLNIVVFEEVELLKGR